MFPETLITDISIVLRKGLRHEYFNSTTISTLFVLPAAMVFPVFLAWNLNDLESFMSRFIIHLKTVFRPEFQ